MPWLPVKEDGMHPGVSTFFSFFFWILLINFLGKEGRSARPAPLPNSGVQRRGGGHHQGVLEEDGGCGGREQWQEEVEEEGGG